MSVNTLERRQAAGLERYTPENPPPPLNHMPKVLLASSMLALAVVAAHIGKLDITALYYLAFQIIHPVKHFWDNLLDKHIPIMSKADWTYWRHSAGRDVPEGLLGGCLAQFIVANPYKKPLKPINRLDRIEHKFGVPNVKYREPLNGRQVAFWWVYVSAYALPVMIVAAGAIRYFNVHSLQHVAPTMTYADKIKALWTDDYGNVIVGLLASFVFGRRPMKKVALDVQHRFAQRRKNAGKGVRFYDPPPFRALLHDLDASSAVPITPPAWENVMLVTVSTLIVAAAIFGYIVLTVIAKQ